MQHTLSSLEDKRQSRESRDCSKISNNRRNYNKSIKDNSLYGEKTLGTHI